MFAASLLLGACADPLDRRTSDIDADTCRGAEANGRLEIAEQACHRALGNVDGGNLGPTLKSQRLYNLARIKRRLSKYVEAENLLRQSIPIELELTGPRSAQTGRRYVELAVDLAGQGRWVDGADYLDRALPLIERFGPGERAYLREILPAFGDALVKEGQQERAARYIQTAATL